ncbi:DUF3530 family protein [Stutzerimonas azotifigens]|uniref:DUF3530 family protein n=1 Tax=Stutzerimonas azotifigens TaxID=291995 RepID=UPI0003F4BF3E|nr:DUF3530 family protein [Stutzerimonas azotifigens]
MAARTWLLLPLALLAMSVRAEEPAPEATPAQPAVERAPLPERSTLEASTLASAYPEQARQLEASPANGAGEQFLALWKPANAPTARGVIVLVPGTGESADWPEVIGPLRKRLPDDGWHTLSLTLPDPASDPATRARPAEPEGPSPDADHKPADEEAPDSEPAPPAEQSPNDPGRDDAPETSPAERIAARLDAALAFAAEQQAATVVLLGHGSGAYWAARYLAERQPPEVERLALIEARQPAAVEPKLAGLAAAQEGPVLDLYQRSERTDAAARERRDATRREDRSDYRQIGLAPAAGDPERLYRRVRGWLDGGP